MKNIDYQVTRETLSIIRDDNVAVHCKFPYLIAQVLTFISTLVVRLEIPKGICFNENVYGVFLNGDIAWRVKPRKHVYEDSPYTSLVRHNGKVKLMNWDGLELIVDPATGMELDENYGR